MLSEASLVGGYILNGGPGCPTSKLRFVGSNTLCSPSRGMHRRGRPRPPHCVRQTLVERHFWLPPKHLARPRDVGFDMARLSRAAPRVHDRVSAVPAAESRKDVIGELPDGKALTAPQVEHASIGGGICQRRNPRVGDVVDIDEVTRLMTVTVDGERLAAQEIADEDS